ncbi:MAG: class I SAM-dependent methyltransferase [Terriglobia bacterium]
MAFVHDAGFRDYCLNAAPGLLRALKRNGITGGLVVDLGCGSGRWACELNRAGYEVLGVDQSPAFIRLARKIAPQSRFVNASLLRVALPACDAVTSIGECLNYAFDRKAGKTELASLFARVNRALGPGGVFIFDVAEPARIPANGPRRLWFQGADWAILVETAGDRKQNTLTRQITCFRKRGRQYQRSEETHRLHLYPGAEIVEMLGQAGFEARRLAAYGRFRLPVGIAAFLARK